MSSTWVVERAVLVNTSAAELFELINSPRQWQLWTVWTGSEEGDLRITYPEQAPEAGVGARATWVRGRVRSELLFTKSAKNAEISYTLSIHGGRFVVEGTIVLGVADTYFTQVAWRCSLQPIASLNPIQRYLGAQLHAAFDADIEESLQNLVQRFHNSHPVEE